MANAIWTMVSGVNQMDDAEVGIFARKNTYGNTEVAFPNGVGVGIVELTGDLNLVSATVHVPGGTATVTTEEVDKLLSDAAVNMSGCQVYLAMAMDDKKVIVGFDEMGETHFYGCDKLSISVESSCEFGVEEYGEMEDDYEGLSYAMGLYEE